MDNQEERHLRHQLKKKILLRAFSNEMISCKTVSCSFSLILHCKHICSAAEKRPSGLEARWSLLSPGQNHRHLSSCNIYWAWDWVCLSS